MVGVAGRSKACLDCKRRRVKCDLAKPLCLRCTKAGIQCQGYKAPLIWVNRTLEQPGVTADSVIVAATRLPLNPAERRLHRLDQLKAEYASPQRDPLQFRSHALQLLRGTYIPCQPPESDSPSPVSWLEAVGEMKASCDALDQSLLALCAIQVRVAGEDSISYEHTVQLYNHALGTVIKDLDRGTAANDETLAAICTVSTCEMFIFIKDQSFSAHAYGISEILRHRDVFQPSLYWDRLVVRICIICLVHSLTYGRALTLGHEEWSILFGPVKTESFTHMLKICVELPSLLEKGDALLRRGYGDASTAHCSDVLIRKYHELEAWRAQRPVPYWVVPSVLENPADDDHGDKLFPFALRFHSLSIAVQWIFCSSLMLQALDVGLALQALDDASLGSTLPHVHSMMLQNDAEKLARLLCQCFEYCYSPENGTFGVQATVVTKWAVQKYFQQHGRLREFKWCKNIDGMRETSQCRFELMAVGLQQ